MDNLKKSLALADKFFVTGEYKLALDKYSWVNSRSDKLLTDSQYSNLQKCERVIYGVEDVSKLTVDDLDYPVQRYLRQHENLNFASTPLVSVVITTHNTGSYIKRCLDSLRKQTYSMLEVIIVDDASSDNSVQIIKKYQLSYPDFDLRLLRLSCNLGTYFAKNYGIKEAKGEYIFFQDSDDFSHKERIRLCMYEILKHNWLGIRCEYVRINEHDQVVRVNNYISKIGLIVLGFHKSVFSKIGYFNPTIKGSDDEFNWRFRTFIGKHQYGDLLLPLYFALVRADSLFVDMVASYTETNIVQQPSDLRRVYINTAQDFYLKIPADECVSYFNFPSLRDKIDVAPEMSKLSNPKYPVVLNFLINEDNLYTILLCGLASLWMQYDIINIFTDKQSIYDRIVSEKSMNTQVYFAENISTELLSLRVLQHLKISYGAVYWINLPVLSYYAPDFINFVLISLRNNLSHNIIWLNTDNFVETMQDKILQADDEDITMDNGLSYWGVAFFSADITFNIYKLWCMRSNDFVFDFLNLCLNTDLENISLNLEVY